MIDNPTSRQILTDPEHVNRAWEREMYQAISEYVRRNAEGLPRKKG